MKKDPVQYSLSFKIQVAKYKKTYGMAKTALKFGIDESDIRSWRIEGLLHEEAVKRQTVNESVQPVSEMDTDNTTSENTENILKQKPFSCRYCISKFSKVGNLKSHMRTFHQGDITKEVLSKKSLSLGISSSRGR